MKFEDFHHLPPAKKLAPLVLLLGDERFFREEAIREIAAALGPGVERAELRAAARGGADVAVLLDEARTRSLFAQKKLVVVREAQHLIADRAAALAEIAAHAAPGVVLVLDASGLDRRTKAAKEVEKAALLVEAKPLFAEPPPWQKGGRPWDSPLVDWVVRRARERGKTLSSENAYHLTQVTGNDLFEIAATLEKLELLLGAEGRAGVSEADIEAIAGHSRRDDAFAVADAIGRRKLDDALAALDRVFRRGVEDRKGGVITDAGTIALFVFARVYAKLDEIRRALPFVADGAVRKEALVEALGVPAFLVDRLLGEARRFRDVDMRRAFRDLLAADLAVKGEPPGPRRALERLAVRLCGGPASAPLASAARGR
jgi:DNA polymerase-3 subunit delta